MIRDNLNFLNLYLDRTNYILRSSLVFLLLSSVYSLSIAQDCDAPAVGYGLIEDTDQYVIINPDPLNPMDVVPCNMQFMGMPFIPDPGGSAYDPGTMRLYVFDGSDLYYVDVTAPCDGDNVTFVGDTMIANPVSGAELQFANGMAILWVIDSGFPGVLYSIDPTDGTILTMVELNGQITNLDGLAIDPNSDPNDPNLIFFGIDDDSKSVYNFSPVTGETFFCYFIDDTNQSINASSFSYGPDGFIYFESDEGSEMDTIYRITPPAICDASTQTPEAVAAFENVPGNISTLAFNATECLQQCPELECDVSEVSPTSCDDTSDGSAIAGVIGGEAPYTYLWDNGETTETATMLSSGLRTVTITDANSCEVVCEVTITSPEPITCSVVLINDILCNGDNNGSASVEVEGGTPGFTFEWSNGETTVIATNLLPGVNAVTVTDANMCQTRCEITIAEPPLLTCAVTVDQNVSCFGGNDGSATVVPDGGTAPFTYEWINGETGQTASMLPMGLIPVTVTDANMCQTVCSVSITEPEELTCTVAVLSDVLCAGDLTGSAEANPVGGTPVYSYLWDNGETTKIATMLDAGPHTVTVTDMNMCTTTCMTTISETTTLTCGINVENDVSCNGFSDGSATIAPMGGAPGYTFLWSDGQTTATASGLAAGDFSATVTDMNNCSTVCTVTITEPAQLTIVINSIESVSCNGLSDASAEAVVNGGTAPYSYLWDDGQTTALAMNLDAGESSVTVTDANGCTIVDSITIVEPPELTCAVSLENNVTCNGDDDGSATVVIAGGTPGYTILWDNGQTTATATGLDPGETVVTVTDANGCVTTCSIVIVEPVELTCTVSVISNVLCTGESNGSAEAMPAGGTAPFTYVWDNGETDAVATMLDAGPQSVTVTDANGCVTTCMATIEETTDLLCSISVDQNVSCNGFSDGAATISPTGGLPGYTFLWSDGQTTATATGLAAGDYSATVTDSNNCTTTCDVSITEPTALSIEINLNNNIVCFGDDNGSATAVPSNGTSPYTFIWDNGQTTATATGLDPGLTLVTVTDANACQIIGEITIVEPPLLECSVALVNNITCNGDNDGSATVTATGGTPEYSYLWDNGQTTRTATGLEPGLTVVTVTDANLCVTTCSITITEPDELSCTVALINNVLCIGESNGSAEATPAGGTGPYTYLWDNGETTAVATMLDAGVTTVTVTDANNCMTTCEITITQNTELSCTIDVDETVSCNGLSDGSATIVATGGAGEYSYAWPDGQTSATAIGLAAGDYTSTVTDGNGCTTTCTVTITEPDELACNISVLEELDCFGDMDAIAQVSPLGGTPEFTYAWSAGEAMMTGSGSTATGLGFGEVFVTITDMNNCESVCSIVIDQPDPISCMIVQTAFILCNGDLTGEIEASGSGGRGIYEYSIDGTTFQDSGIFTDLAAGTYTVTVREPDNINCMSTCDITLTEPSVLSCAVVSTDETNCGASDGTITATAFGGTAPYTYSGAGLITNTTGEFADLTSGSYIVTITDANGCVVNCMEVIIFTPTAPTCTLVETNSILCNGDLTGEITATGADGSGNYEFSLDGITFQDSGIFTDLGAGAYSVTVRDPGNTDCISVCTVILSEPDALECSATATDESDCGAFDGTITAEATGGVGPYTYSGNGLETNTTGMFSGLIAGTYTVIITDSNGCTVDCSEVVIAAPMAPTCTLNQTNQILCFGDLTGAILAVGADGSGNYEFSINGTDFQPSGAFTDLAAGGYTVTVRDPGNLSCLSICTITIAQPELLTCASAATDETDCGSGDGTITVTASGGVGPYTYSGADLTTNDTGVFTDLLSGAYTVTIEDSNGCIVECDPVIISSPSAPSCTVVETVAILCNGEATGEITATGADGSGNYEYSIDGTNFQPSGVFASLSAGDYTVTVRDPGNIMCISACTITLGEPAALVCSASTTDESDCGAFDGTITAIGSGGVGPYTYSGAGLTTNTTGVFTSLVAGSYTVVITDANNCTVECSEVIISSPSAPTCTVTVTSAIQCNGDATGQITAVGSEGSGNYEYSLDGVNFQNSGEFDGLIAGSYSITVRDPDNTSCLSICTIILTEPDALTCTATSTGESDCGASDGTITVTATGGTAPYTYSGLGLTSNTSGQFTGLISGSYTVIITDNNGCTVDCAEVMITTPNAPSCSITETSSILCNGDASAEITVTGTGGSGNYEYSLDGSAFQSSGVFANLVAGSYTVTVRDPDNQSCISFCSIVVEEPEDLSCNLRVEQEVSCFGANDAIVIASPQGGTPAYTYAWSAGNASMTGSGSTASGLGFGLVSVTITDDNGCQSECTIQVDQPTELICNVSLINNISCFGADDGSATVSFSGGTPGYSILWDDGQTTATATGLTPGLQAVTVTDANGCETSCSITIVEPIEFICEVTKLNDVFCANEMTGGARADVISGGIAPFTYLWDNGVSTQTVNNLDGGIHFVTVTDANGCETVCDIIINDQSGLSCVISLENTVSCFGFSDGSATASVTGGVAGYTYLWDNGETTSTATNLAAGFTQLTVTDSNNCTTICNITITEPDALSLAAPITTVSVTCDGLGDNGQATAMPTGGTEPYSYAWPSGEATQTAVGLSPGIGAVTITDANDCELIESYNIESPEFPSVTFDNISPISCLSFFNGDSNDGSATAVVTGGIMPYDFIWSTGETTQTADMLVEGINTVTVTDNFGCASAFDVTISFASCLDITLDKSGQLSDPEADLVPGVPINYTFEVCNTGTTTLNNIIVTDPLITVNDGPISLEPGECNNLNFTGVYNITQDDIDNRMVSNQAIVTGTDALGNSTSELSNDPTTIVGLDATIIGLRAPAIGLEKLADVSEVNSPPQPGDIINYQFIICNTGDIDLTEVRVIDLGITVDQTTIPFLASGACDSSSITGSYPITSTDIAIGFYENSATVEGLDDDEEVITDRSDDPTDLTNIDSNGDGDPDDPTIVPLEAFPAFELEKTGALNNECPMAGDLISYSFTVCNTGNVDLTEITLTDNNVTLVGSAIAILRVGECNSQAYTATYPLTQSDIDNGAVQNSASVRGVAPNGIIINDISDDPNDPSDNDIEMDGDPDDPTFTIIPQKGEIALTKSGTFNDESGDNIAQEGETVSYSFTVTNTGNVTLNNISLNDPLISLEGGPIVSLAVGETDELTFTGDYSLQIIDLENAFVINSAIASGFDPADGIITDLSDDVDDLTNVNINGNGNPDDPTKVIYNVRECDELVCNQDLQISLGTECRVDLNKDNTLEDPAFGFYEFFVYHEDTLFSEGILDETSVGKSFTYKVTCGGNSCWGTLSVEANRIPILTSPCEPGPNGEIDPRCTGVCLEERPSIILDEDEATSILNSKCTATLIGNLKVRETRTGDLCDPSGEVITIVYSAKFERHGVVQEQELLTQQYRIDKYDIADVFFPEDVFLDCSITDLSPRVIFGTGQRIEKVYPYVLDTAFIPEPDTLEICDTLLVEVVIGTHEEMVLQVIDGEEVWTLITVVDKRLVKSDKVNCIVIVDDIIEEEDRLVPIDENYCNLVSSYADLDFQGCGGNRKVFREWTVIDWCDKSFSATDIQTIETVDSLPPVILRTFNDVFVNIEPWTCTGVLDLRNFIFPDQISERCSDVEIRYETDHGRIVDGRLIDIPLTNDLIRVDLIVSDECGNESRAFFNVKTRDLTRPVVICELDINVTITGREDNGAAVVYAETLDEGSHDAGCGPVSLSVVRLEDFREPVFNCAGDTLGFVPVTCGALIEELPAASTEATEKGASCEDVKTAVTKPGDYVKFCCEDVGQEVEVILIATDKFGNSNYCVVTVFVSDKSEAILHCPPVSISCNDDVDNAKPTLIGTICPLAELDLILLDETSDSGQCTNSTITREWYLDVDESGDYNVGDAYCKQLLSINGEGTVLDPYSIKWPKHFDDGLQDGVNIECVGSERTETSADVPMGAAIDCESEQDLLSPSWCVADCSLVGTSIEIDTITASESCFKIIRRWTVVDWCTWDSNSSDTDDENDSSRDQFEAVEDWAQGICDDCPQNSSQQDPVYFRYAEVELDGYYTFDQIIKVVDTTEPTIVDAPGLLEVNITGGRQSKADMATCEITEMITVSATDFCGAINSNPVGLRWNISVSKDGVVVASKEVRGATASMSTQTGAQGDIHVITWRVSDGCNNTATAVTEVRFEDRKNPTPFCVSGLSSVISDADGMITAWGKEFNFGSFDNCTSEEDLLYTIVPSGDEPAKPGDDGFEDQTGITFFCEDMQNFSNLDVWVWDEQGNGDFCSVSLTLGTDCDEVQVGSGARIAGSISTEYGESVSEVEVTVSTGLAEYPKTVMTSESGRYSFTNNPLDYNYRISSSKDTDYINGVSTIDLVLIQRHIIGDTPLNSEYKIIASDANDDDKVTAGDILALRKLILGVTDDLANSESWRFVDKAQTFFDINDPWPFIEQLDIIDLSANENQNDFVAVKIGDVNQNATVNLSTRSQIRSNTELEFNIENREVNQGNRFTMDLFSDDFESVYGFQFTLEHPGLVVTDVYSDNINISEAHYAVHDGFTTISWNQDEAISVVKTSIFSIDFESSIRTELKDVVAITSRVTADEAYLGSLANVSSVSLGLTDDDIAEAYELYQNTPNPFSESTVIPFSLPRADKASLSIFDAAGKTIKVVTGSFSAGYNQFNISKEALETSGVLYYRLESASFTDMKKMIVLE